MSAPVTLNGRLTKDPELRFSGAGNAVAVFTVVTDRRRKNKDSGEWESTETSFWDVTAFGQLAENVCESLLKGQRVVVVGDAHQETYEAKDGSGKRSTWKVIAQDAGPSLRYDKATVTQQAERGQQRQMEKAPF